MYPEITQASRLTSWNCAEMAGMDTATMVWSSAPRKIAIIKAASTLRTAGTGWVGWLRLVTAKPSSKAHGAERARGNARYDSRLLDSFVSKPDVIFCNGCAPCLRIDEIRQLTLGDALAEAIRVRKLVQHGGHPPGKPLGLPHPAQADHRVLLQ